MNEDNTCPDCGEHKIDCLCAERAARDAELDFFQEDA